MKMPKMRKMRIYIKMRTMAIPEIHPMIRDGDLIHQE